MIDVHCHLEQKDYDKDRDEFIESLKKELRAVISNATHGDDLDKSLEIARHHADFVFLCAGIHPQLIQEVSKELREECFAKIREHENSIVSIGEAGMDFYWVEDAAARELQKRYFHEDIAFARSLGKPVTVHSRNAFEETAQILAEEQYDRVHWHLFKDFSLVPLVIKHGWRISVGPLLLSSKTMKKIVRDVPLAQIMLETDSPWWGLRIGDPESSEPRSEGGGQRGTPLNIKPVAQRIAEIKKLPFEDVWVACGKNAAEFFKLPLHI